MDAIPRATGVCSKCGDPAHVFDLKWTHADGSALCGVVKDQVGRLRVADAMSGVGQLIAEAMNGPECFKCHEPITDFREVRIVTVRIDDKPVNVWVHDAHAKPGIVGPLDEYRGQ